MRRLVQLALLQAWGGSATVAAIAKRNGLSQRTVNRFWAECRADGRLPNTHRPAFPPAETATPAALFDSDPDSPMGDDDVRHHDPAEVAAIQTAASLTALRLAHSDLDDPAAHVAPRDWFNRKGVPPTHFELMAMCRAFDARSRHVRIVIHKSRHMGRRFVPESV